MLTQRRLRVELIGVLVSVAMAVGTPPAGAATPLPGFFTGPPGGPGDRIAVRPASITFNSETPITFSGTARDGAPITWTSWTSTDATAAGAVWEDPCVPYCAAEGYDRYTARVRLSDPVTLGGRLLFRTMAITYTTTKRLPGPRHIIRLTLTDGRHGYGFDFTTAPTT